MRRILGGLVAGLCLLTVAIGAFVRSSPFPWDPVIPGEAACLARPQGDAAATALHWDGGPETIPAAAQKERGRLQVGLRREWLLRARPVPGEWTEAWCEITPLDAELGRAPLQAYGSGWYARTSTLAALSVAEARATGRLPGAGSSLDRLSLTDAFAMEYVEASDATITGERRAETVIRQQWPRTPGTIGVSIYHADKGVPRWLFARVLWSVLWCDPVVRVRAKGPSRSRAGIVAFQPPFWLMVYEWDGERFALTGTHRTGVLDAAGAVFWSYRRWLALVGAAAVLTTLRAAWRGLRRVWSRARRGRRTVTSCMDGRSRSTST